MNLILTIPCVVVLTLALSGCAPSIQTGQANVMRAVEKSDLNTLGSLAVDHGNDDVRIDALHGFQSFPNNEKAVLFIGEVLAKTYSPTVKRAAIQAYLYQLGFDQARSSVTAFPTDKALRIFPPRSTNFAS